MPRKRMLDPSFWDDTDVQSLTRDERLLLIGLFDLADDYGHISGNPAQLRKWVFGYDLDLAVEDLRRMRDHICNACRNVILYRVDGQEYIHLRRWERHQDLRFRAKAQYPCHACGAFHTAHDFRECERLPVNSQYLPQDLTEPLRIYTQDIANNCSPREVKIRKEKIRDPLRGDETSPEPVKQVHASAKGLAPEDRQMWAVLLREFKILPGATFPSTARAKWNAAIAQLRQGGAKPDDIPSLIHAYTERMGKPPPTPMALAGHVPELQAPQRERDGPPPEYPDAATVMAEVMRS